jgi:glucose/arabinose dehydrogenase
VAAAVATVVALGAGAACSDGDGTPATRPTEPPPTRTSTSTTTTAPPSTTTTTVPPNLDAVSLRLEEVASGFESPVALAWRAGDGRPYVVEQPGRIRIADGARPLDPPVLEIAVSRGNEQGLLGIAFSPDGTKLYVDYTDPNGHTHVDEYTMRGDVAEPGSRRELLFVGQPFPNHNGGQLQIGPDGMLYVSLGDGGSGGDPEENAQDLSTLLGKVLRIDPVGTPYAVPADNPFVGSAGARPEIWMYGLRNPWRFSFDRATGDVWIADVGQNAFEEIDFSPLAQAAGANWGWDEREGFHEFEGGLPPGARDPVAERPLGDAYCALIGGYVYRGAAVDFLRGAYLFTDHCRGVVEGLVLRDGAVVAQRDMGVEIASPTTFGEDPAGELYVASRGGAIYRIVNASRGA